MRKVTLLFPDAEYLRRFIQIAKCSYLEVIAEDSALTCDCGEAEIELAKTGFNANVFNLRPTGF